MKKMNKKTNIDLITETSFLMADIEKGLDKLSLNTLKFLRRVIEDKIDIMNKKSPHP